MTAEIAILNKSAVALAADSAATVGGGQGKIYNTVNKLFTLSKHRPVGVMIYGNAQFMGVPFETLIKIYREALKDTSKATVEQYANAFIKFFESKSFATEIQQHQNVSRIWVSVFEDLTGVLQSQVLEEFRSKGNATKKTQKRLALNLFDAQIALLEGKKFAKGFGRKTHASIVKTFSKAFADTTKSSFPNDLLDTSSKNALSKIAGLSVVKEYYSSSNSGIVIAGFGEDELFPHLMHTRTDGIIVGIHKREPWENLGNL